MSIYKRGDVWWIDVRVGATRRRVRRSSGCTDETQARIVEQSMVAMNRGLTTRSRTRAIIDALAPDESVSLDKIATWYANLLVTEKTSLSRLETQKRMSAISKAVAWLATNSRAAAADDVSPDLAWRYACYFEEARHCSVKTRNAQVGMLHCVWEQLVRHGKATSNPWRLARGARRVAEESHGRAFSADEIGRILEAARALGCEWEGVVTLALYTGLRKRDVETLRWDDVDEAHGLIAKTPGKTARRGIRVAIPMHEAVRRVLADADRSSAFVFPWRAAHPAGQRPKIGDHPFAEVLARAGVVAQAGERISFHCLRHTFVTRLAEAGVAQDVRMRLAGHTNAATSNLYTHDLAASRDAIARLA